MTKCTNLSANNITDQFQFSIHFHLYCLFKYDDIHVRAVNQSLNGLFCVCNFVLALICCIGLLGRAHGSVDVIGHMGQLWFIVENIFQPVTANL